MRTILSIMLISVLGVLIACQSSAAPTSVKQIAENTPPVAANQSDGHNHSEDEAARISLEDAKKAFDAGDAVFIDTRGADSYNAEHIEGAINIPAAEFETRYKEVPKDKKIIAYCS